MSKNITAIIPARSGSKGLPNKNIKLFAGSPLIVHSINYALESKLVNNIIVSTDCEKIATIAKKATANVLIRPVELATDKSTTESVIEHYINSETKKPDIIILLQPTSPVRPPFSLDPALNHFIKFKFDSLLSICPTHNFFWKINPNNMIAEPEYDFYSRPRRQDIKPKNMRFIENGSIYIFSLEHFLKTGNRLGGKIGYVEWPEKYLMEIDTLLDFNILENIFLKKITNLDNL